MQNYKMTLFHNMSVWSDSGVYITGIFFSKISIKDVFFCSNKKKRTDFNIYPFIGCVNHEVEEVFINQNTKPSVDTTFYDKTLFTLYTLYMIYNVDYVVYASYNNVKPVIVKCISLYTLRGILKSNFKQQYADDILPVYIHKDSKTAFLLSGVNYFYKSAFLKEI
jgi:hypothetical protein